MGWISRLGSVRYRLVTLERAGERAGLSEGDPGGTERWADVEIWGHIGEFPGYWLDQLQHVIAAGPGRAIPFGRTKSDPARTSAVAAAQREDVGHYLRSMLEACEALEALLGAMDDDDWAASGLHETLGEMGVEAILEEFLIGHLEEHAAQLEALDA